MKNVIHIHQNKELRFVKKCLLGYFFAPLCGAILLVLFLVSSGAKPLQVSNLFNSQSAYIVLLSLFLCALGFIMGAVGFYRLSKITRHLEFFENFAFSFLAVILCTLLSYLVPNASNALSLIGNGVSVFYLYKLYRELSLYTQERFFLSGFRLLLFSFMIALLGVLVQALGVIFLGVAVILMCVAFSFLGRAFLNFSQVFLKA
ncbi:hypothetical protein [Helicobacter pylori]|uniref:hypothetical protein n=1 Tax=Helicobacter pylori TaxID=210 RepID=UPI000BEEEF70|nr:hypothetical protein [Helicobacter pylori]NHB18047.1 hypothetical protein [Helicobacter pylori]OPG43484.1 hypothetical protein BGL73_04325 [Helicobacter pylori]QEF44373.1 hypothetical protein D2C71_00910 [Helicobacter pylori]